MMKNSEWGAAAYLAYSSYGRNGTDIGVNNSAGYVTGGGDYKTNVAQTTTGNVTGIYDMSSYVATRTASYVASTTALGHAASGYGYGMVIGGTQTLASQSTKYVTIYQTGATDSDVNDYAANSYLSTPKKFGDGIYETSNSGAGNTSWFSKPTNFPNGANPYFNRGGNGDLDTAAGMFAVQNSSGGLGSAGSEKSFRMVLAP